ncbi:MAG: hypothetical protein H7A32_02525 [Deltaproteobacteria bacterium]|nr:hypothetical protein [Deltaproteobacteria bacterium]
MLTSISSQSALLMTNVGSSAGRQSKTQTSPLNSPAKGSKLPSVREIIEKGRARIRAKRAAEAKKASGQPAKGSKPTTQKTPASQPAQPATKPGNSSIKPGRSSMPPSFQPWPSWQPKKAPQKPEANPDSSPQVKKPEQGEPYPPRDYDNPTIPVWDGEKVVHLPGVPTPGIEVGDGAEVWVGGERKYPKWSGEKNDQGVPVGPGHWELPELSAKKYAAADHISRYVQVGDMALVGVIAVIALGEVLTAGAATYMLPAIAGADQEGGSSSRRSLKEQPGSIGYDQKSQLYYIVDEDGDKNIGFAREQEAIDYLVNLRERSLE